MLILRDTKADNKIELSAHVFNYESYRAEPDKFELPPFAAGIPLTSVPIGIVERCRLSSGNFKKDRALATATRGRVSRGDVEVKASRHVYGSYREEKFQDNL